MKSTWLLTCLAGLVCTATAYITQHTVAKCRRNADEGAGCTYTARAGLCSNKNNPDTTHKMWQNCPCSCMQAAEKRLMGCCTSVSVNMFETPEIAQHLVECTNLCTHKLTKEILKKRETMKCLDLLHVLTYCGLEGRDVRPCCEKKGLNKKCQRFCMAGFSPAICGQNTEDYMDCLDDNGLNKMRECYLANLDKKPQWNKDWKPQCTKQPNGDFDVKFAPPRSRSPSTSGRSTSGSSSRGSSGTSSRGTAGRSSNPRTAFKGQ